MSLSNPAGSGLIGAATIGDVVVEKSRRGRPPGSRNAHKGPAGSIRLATRESIESLRVRPEVAAKFCRPSREQVSEWARKFAPKGAQ